MKKLISSILVALIILSAVAAPAHAAEVDTITLNEAVELAKKYSSDSAPAFVNGVLAKVAN